MSLLVQDPGHGVDFTPGRTKTGTVQFTILVNHFSWGILWIIPLNFSISWISVWYLGHLHTKKPNITLRYPGHFFRKNGSLSLPCSQAYYPTFPLYYAGTCTIHIKFCSQCGWFHGCIEQFNHRLCWVFYSNLRSATGSGRSHHKQHWRSNMHHGEQFIWLKFIRPRWAASSPILGLEKNPFWPPSIMLSHNPSSTSLKYDNKIPRLKVWSWNDFLFDNGSHELIRTILTIHNDSLSQWTYCNLIQSSSLQLMKYLAILPET